MAKRSPMSSLQASRTLVKSPPELWAELSDLGSLPATSASSGRSGSRRWTPSHESNGRRTARAGPSGSSPRAGGPAWCSRSTRRSPRADPSRRLAAAIERRPKRNRWPRPKRRVARRGRSRPGCGRARRPSTARPRPGRPMAAPTARWRKAIVRKRPTSRSAAEEPAPKRGLGAPVRPRRGARRARARAGARRRRARAGARARGALRGRQAVRHHRVGGPRAARRRGGARAGAGRAVRPRGRAPHRARHPRRRAPPPLQPVLGLSKNRRCIRACRLLGRPLIPGRPVPPDTERSILTAPGPVAKTAALAAREPEQRWMLAQPRDVRRSYADEVFGRPDHQERQEVWMLRQPKPVRESFIREVLAGGTRRPASRSGCCARPTRSASPTSRRSWSREAGRDPRHHTAQPGGRLRLPGRLRQSGGVALRRRLDRSS